MKYVEDAPRAGRPPISLEMKTLLVQLVTKDRFGREASANKLKYKLESTISPATIRRILKEYKYHKVKPIYKPGLSPAMKKARFEWAWECRNWTLEDFKNLVFSDETSVVLGQQRGSQ